MAAASCADERQLLAVLKYHLGLDGFRPGQLDAVQATLSGKDSLVILPTGAGKSLTFCLPPLVKDHSFTVVISPLLALAKDQMRSCEDKGIEAEVFNSEVDEARKKRIISELVDPETTLKLLYTTPESLQMPRLRDALKEAHASGRLCGFAVDEAHCVSEWGCDFRPAYLQLSSLRGDFPGVPIAALTASCTDAVRDNIVSALRLSHPVVVRRSFNRPNIRYEVRHKELLGDGSDAAVLADLLAFLAERPGQGGIVYARLRATCDWLVGELAAAGHDASAYHAGREPRQRARVQEDWTSGATSIVVATIAFGMGIDRPDVRWVVHWNASSSLEAFYQESGRAGRDGLPCVSLAYVSRADLEGAQRCEKAARAGAVSEVAQWALAPGCRRKKLLAYFSEQRPPGGCAAAAGSSAGNAATGPTGDNGAEGGPSRRRQQQQQEKEEHASSVGHEERCDWCADSKRVSAALQQLEGLRLAQLAGASAATMRSADREWLMMGRQAAGGGSTEGEESVTAAASSSSSKPFDVSSLLATGKQRLSQQQQQPSAGMRAPGMPAAARLAAPFALPGPVARNAATPSYHHHQVAAEMPPAAPAAPLAPPPLPQQMQQQPKRMPLLMKRPSSFNTVPPLPPAAGTTPNAAPAPPLKPSARVSVALQMPSFFDVTPPDAAEGAATGLCSAPAAGQQGSQPNGDHHLRAAAADVALLAAAEQQQALQLTAEPIKRRKFVPPLLRPLQPR